MDSKIDVLTSLAEGNLLANRPRCASMGKNWGMVFFQVGRFAKLCDGPRKKLKYVLRTFAWLKISEMAAHKNIR